MLACCYALVAANQCKAGSATGAAGTFHVVFMLGKVVRLL